MEVGAVKQAFNNEVILLKKKLNQAKIQVIHKLTRKAKTLTEKKAPEQLKEKLKKKAESAVNEVLIIKKVKAKDLAKFMVTHKGDLKDYLNRPKVDEEKACARLLLHKTMEDKYIFFRGRFSNMPIQDLFMSRLERRKMKKEAKEKQKNKKKGKDSKVVNSAGDWNVEDLGMGDGEVADDNKATDEGSGDESERAELDEESNDELMQMQSKTGDSDDLQQKDGEGNSSEAENEEDSDKKVSSDEEIEVTPKASIPKNIETRKQKLKVETLSIKARKNESNKDVLPKEHKPHPNKNKNLNEKLIQRKFKKETEAPVVENKIVDPFFITSSGENYMSVVEPRQPDEIKEVHKQGNRKLRRAVMFGHVPKTKPRYDNYRPDNNFNKYNNYESENSYGKGNNYKNKFNNDSDFNDNKRTFNIKDDYKVEKEEKLHPSWEAKKKQSGILPFEGKKIVFDDS